MARFPQRDHQAIGLLSGDRHRHHRLPLPWPDSHRPAHREPSRLGGITDQPCDGLDPLHAAIYLVAYYGVILLAKLLRMVSHAVFLGPLDRIAGAAFSVAKYFLLVSLLLNLYMVIFPDTPLRTKSNLCGGRVVTLTARFAPWVLDAVSPLGTDDDQNLKTEQTDKAPVPTRTNV